MNKLSQCRKRKNKNIILNHMKTVKNFDIKHCLKANGIS